MSDTCEFNYRDAKFIETVTVEDIYKTSTPDIPVGYKVVDFRIPQLEEYIRNFGHNEAVKLDTKWKPTTPRLILTKLPPPVTVEDVYDMSQECITAPSGYELTGEFRTPLVGESYLNYKNYRIIGIVHQDFNPAGPRLIVKKKVERVRRTWVVEEVFPEEQVSNTQWFNKTWVRVVENDKC